MKATINRYGIVKQDIYNFDKTGFCMGYISAHMVITLVERNVSKAKTIQPGNREWTTVIQGISAGGWTLPPYVIFAAKYYQQAWYEGSLPGDWTIAVSDNGWTTNQHGLAWIKLFDRQTSSKTAGAYRLLIIDGHASHLSPEFESFCMQHKIIIVCMPSHSSHLLQPLDVGCFGPLKHAYGDAVMKLARRAVSHVSKVDFLRAFQSAYTKAFSLDNIRASFKGTGLVPFNPDAVLEKLDICLFTPTPPLVDEVWQSQKPQNTRQFEAQHKLIRDQLHDTSPRVQESIEKLAKGAQAMIHSATLICDELSNLQSTAQEQQQRKSRKRRYIQEGHLTVSEARNIGSQEFIEEERPRQARRLSESLEASSRTANL